MAIELVEIGQIAVIAHDVARARDFYRDVLSLPYLFEAPGLAFFRCGPVRLMLSKPERPEFDHPGSPIYFRVADIQTAHAELLSKGIAFESPPHAVHRTPEMELWMAFFRDSEGNPLVLMSEIGRPAAPE